MVEVNWIVEGILLTFVWWMNRLCESVPGVLEPAAGVGILGKTVYLSAVLKGSRYLLERASLIRCFVLG